MYELLPVYLEKLEIIAGEIQESPELKQYLEEEEEEYYNALKDTYEPRMYEIYKDVATTHPLQLIHLERILLDTAFEGLFLPRILGYSVLRGTITEGYKYNRPQHHFQDVLISICNSANFDILKKRIGQTIQVGFSLSSDIWVTNLINAISNKRVRHYLQALKVPRLRILEERQRDYNRYNKQFKKENFLSIVFPDTTSELAIEYPGLERFLLYRIGTDIDNTSIYPAVDSFVNNDALIGTKGHLQICATYGTFLELPEASKTKLSAAFDKIRETMPEADITLLNFLVSLHSSDKVELTPEADLRLASLITRAKNDQLSDYFTLIETIHNDGYTNEKVHESIRSVYMKHEGLSAFNEGIRRTIFQYFAKYINNLGAGEYSSFFDITKMFTIYIGLFLNQQFNQDIKDLSMNYVKKLLKTYTDKRGRDYQDIKKFVSVVFLEQDFLTEKEIVNLFKTRRKRKPVEEV